MLINQCECVCDQDLCKLIRATSQLVRVSVLHRIWFAPVGQLLTIRPEVYVCHRVWVAAKQGPYRAPLTRCFMESINCLKSRWAVWAFPQETRKEAEQSIWRGVSRAHQGSRGGAAGGQQVGWATGHSGMDSACTHHLTLIISLGLLHAPWKLLWEIWHGTTLTLWTVVETLVWKLC